MSTEPLWFFELDGERVGPLSEREMRDRIGSGEIKPETLVWREGMADWATLSQTELASTAGVPRTPPKMPPVLTAVAPIPQTGPSLTRAAVLRPDFRISIGSCYGRAWSLMASRFWPFVGCYALLMLMISVAQQLYAPTFFLIYPLMGGFFWYTLKVMRGERAEFDQMFEGFRRQFGPLAISNLIVIGITMVVVLLIVVVFMVVVAYAAPLFESNAEDPVMMTLLIVGALVIVFLVTLPLTVFGYVGMMSICLILDCGLKAGESLSLAWKALGGQWFKLVLFVVVNMVLSFAGMLAFFVGFLVTSAWATIAFTYLYEDAFGEDPAARQARMA